MQNRKQAFDNISRKLINFSRDIAHHQAIQDYSLNIHAENFFRDVFNYVYDYRLKSANFQNTNAAYIDLLDTDKKLAYQITSTTSKEKIVNTLQALKKPEYQGYEIKVYYLLDKPKLSAETKREIHADFSINIDGHLFDSIDLIKDIDNLEDDKIIGLNHKYFKEIHGDTDNPAKVNIDHLPEPTTALIGRKTELHQLTEAFKNPNKRLAIIVAAGGIGKSALTDEWLKQIEAHNYYGKTRVFGWSFYSQGSHNTFTNSQPFFSAVLPFLGATEIPKDEIEKARLLAQCLREQPCLLILDGLEPLQYAENLSAMNGEVQDSALKEFITCFRRTAGNSFVLLSSRQPLVELKKWQVEHYLSLDLKTLPHEDGADLLQALGVTGDAEERQAISKDLNGHALSLALMGHLLVEHHQGDYRYAKELPPLTSAHGDSDAEKDSRHALRVLDYYDSLQDEASRCFLQLLGLFDRPMKAEEKAVLIREVNHAEPLRALTTKQWQAVGQKLEKSGLLLGKQGSFECLEWDTHPIIRAYFGEKLKENHPEEFKQAHLVLFDYYQKQPEKEFKKHLPDTLEEMQPLYRAIEHGNLGYNHEESFKILETRIWRNNLKNNKYYSQKYLSSYAQDLSTLTSFFEPIWKIKKSCDECEDKNTTNCLDVGKCHYWTLKNNIDSLRRSYLLKRIFFCFMSLGRFIETEQILNLTLAAHKEQKDFEGMLSCQKYFAKISLPLGKKLERLEEDVQNNITSLPYLRKYFEFDELLFYRRFNNHLGTITHRIGKLNLALEKFQQAEEKHLKMLESQNYMPGLGSAWYCRLLLDIASNNDDYKNIIKRVECAKKHAESMNQDFELALSYLSEARLYNALAFRDTNHYKQSMDSIKIAIGLIEKSKDTLYKPLFYLVRADLYLTQNQLDPAQADLNSAWEIIDRCGMKLYQVDYLLIHGRYCLVIKDHDTALNHYIEAKQLIQETGYHLRDAELDLFAAKLRQQCGEQYRHTNPDLYAKTADDYLQKAKNRIEEIGQWGLMPTFEHVKESVSGG